MRSESSFVSGKMLELGCRVGLDGVIFKALIKFLLSILLESLPSIYIQTASKAFFLQFISAATPSLSESRCNTETALIRQC